MCDTPASQCEEWSLHCHFPASAHRLGGATITAAQDGVQAEPPPGACNDPGSVPRAAKGGPHSNNGTAPYPVSHAPNSSAAGLTLFGGALRLPHPPEGSSQPGFRICAAPAPCASARGNATIPACRGIRGRGQGHCGNASAAVRGELQRNPVVAPPVATGGCSGGPLGKERPPCLATNGQPQRKSKDGVMPAANRQLGAIQVLPLFCSYMGNRAPVHGTIQNCSVCLFSRLPQLFSAIAHPCFCSSSLCARAISDTPKAESHIT